MKVRFGCFQFNTKLTDKLIKHCAALFGHVGVVYILAVNILLLQENALFCWFPLGSLLSVNKLL